MEMSAAAIARQRAIERRSRELEVIRLKALL